MTLPASELAARRRRLDPFASSAIERGGPRANFSALGRRAVARADGMARPDAEAPRSLEACLPDGTLLEVPVLPLATQERIDAIFRRVSPERRAELERAGRVLVAAAEEEVDAGDGSPAGVDRRARAKAGLGAAARELEDLLASAGGPAEQEGDGVFVGLAAVERGLIDFFEAFRRRQGLGQDLRAEAAELEDMLASWPEGTTQRFTYHQVEPVDAGAPRAVEKTVTLTADEARALATELGGRAGDLAALGTVDAYRLQKMVQDYQQVTATISNILKGTDESARGAIANIQP